MKKILLIVSSVVILLVAFSMAATADTWCSGWCEWFQSCQDAYGCDGASLCMPDAHDCMCCSKAGRTYSCMCNW